MDCLHPLHTDIAAPRRFTYPFNYEPHPLCLLAAEQVRHELERMQCDMQEGDWAEGKMYGVLVVKSRQGLGFLAAYSGLLAGRNDWPYFVPPVFDAQQPDGHFKQTERDISALNREIETIDRRVSPVTAEKLKAQRRQMSEELQLWLFHQYRFLNALGQVKDAVGVWQDYHSAPKIRRRYPLPPGGTGDCCAPKLLQYAYSQQLKPLCMAEFWWGASPKSEVRHHGQFYPACRGKCKPVLTWMLQGLEVDPDPEQASDSRLVPEIVFEDETMAVVSKPPGLLSIPGKTAHHAVATWAQERWPGAMPAHRLDMLTSGIILIAKTMEAYHNLQEQFEKRTVKKKYLALVEGIPARDHGIIDLPLSGDPLNRPRQMVDYEHGKRAITEYRVLGHYEAQEAGCYLQPSPAGASALPTVTEAPPESQPAQGVVSLLALYPHTGRTHQLRMHCAHKEGLGCPIVGDELYGRKASRLYLQAQAVTFMHPATGRRMHIELSFPFGILTPDSNK